MELLKMKSKNPWTVRWIAAGVFFCVLTLAVVLVALNQSAAVITNANTIRAEAEALMNTIQAGELEALSEMLYGSPDLGTAPKRDKDAQSLLWYAFLDSLQYQIEPQLTTPGDSIAVNMKITCMDLSAATEALQAAAPALLVEKAIALNDEKVVYDENRQYRQEFIADVLLDATRQVLSQPLPEAEHTITLHFVRSGHIWQALPSEELTQLLGGYITQ